MCVNWLGHVNIMAESEYDPSREMLLLDFQVSGQRGSKRRAQSKIMIN